MRTDTIELVQGTLELLILKTLGRGAAMHGFEVLEWIQVATDGALTIEEGSLYPALHRMRKRGWLAAKWGVSPKGRRAKYYSLTRAGIHELQRRQARWRDYVTAVDKIDPFAADA